MTNKKASKTPSTPPKFEFKGFFNPIIGNDIKSAVKALDDHDVQVEDRISALVDVGFKLAISADKANTHYTVTLTDKRANSDSRGYVMSVKHANLSTAVTLAFVLQDEIYEWKGWMVWIDGNNDVDW